jgi:hypothetical protein
MTKKRGRIKLEVVLFLVIILSLSGCAKDIIVANAIYECNENEGSGLIIHGKQSRSFLCLKPPGFTSCYKASNNGLKFCGSSEWDNIGDIVTNELYYEQSERDANRNNVKNNLGSITTTSNNFLDLGDIIINGLNNEEQNVLFTSETRYPNANFLNLNRIDFYDESSKVTVNFFLLECTPETENLVFDKRSESMLKTAQPSELYMCIKEKGIYRWIDKSIILGNDADGDNVPKYWDCNDNDKDVYGDFSLFQGPPLNVICGDGKANTCGVVSETVPDDDCDTLEYKVACTQTCLTSDGQCSWVESSGNYNCCGDDGLNDLGNELVGSLDGQGNSDYLCVTHDKDFVSHKNFNTADPKSSFKNVGWPADDRCEGDWCWISAKQDAKFNVLTVKPLEDKPYDVISNGEQWVKCDENYLTTELSKHLPTPDVDDFQQGDSADILNRKTSRFACYNTNTHTEWVECGAERSEGLITHENRGTIKARFPGEGMYSLRFITSRDDGIFDGENLDVDTKSYKKYYQDDFLFDFTGYTHLNLFFKFKQEVNQVASLNLKIFGPKGENDERPIYFQKSIIGDVVNHPFSQEFMHVRVALPENLKNIEKISITGSQPFLGRNLFLDKGILQNELLCSGDESAQNEWSWIDNIDQKDTNKDITGEDLCVALYGPFAWLDKGLNDPRDADGVDIPSASCCGNGEVDANGEFLKEYYAGNSHKQGGPPGEKYGCWNSRTIKSGETIMNVEYSVEYQPEKFYDVIYPPNQPRSSWSIDLETKRASCEPKHCGAILLRNRPERYICLDGDSECKYGVSYKLKDDSCTSNNCEIDRVVEVCFIQGENTCNAQTSATTCGFNYHVARGSDVDDLDRIFDNNDLNDKLGYIRKIIRETDGDTNNFPPPRILTNTCVVQDIISPVYVTLLSNTIKLSSTKIASFNLNRNDLLPKVEGDSTKGKVKLSNFNDKVNLYFLDPKRPNAWSDGKMIINYDDLIHDMTEIYVMAKMDFDKYTPTSTLQNFPDRESITFTQSCKENEECLFPIPGKSPYKITNEHPGLYELFFVSGDELNEEVLITQPNQEFGVEIDVNQDPVLVQGMLKAKKVAQQVLFLNEDVPGQLRDRDFFGCNVADFMVGGNMVKQTNNLLQCTPKSDFICAYSKTVLGNFPITSINVWDKNDLPETKGVNEDEGEGEDLAILDGFPANELTHSTTVVPARNLLTNADFCESCFEGDVLNGWEVFVDDLPHRNVQGFFIDSHQPQDDPKVTLASNHLLKSVRIPVIDNMQIHYSINTTGNCQDFVTLIDKEGDVISEITLNDGMVFSTLTAEYLTYDISNCKFQQPSLQYIDDKGPVTFGFSEPKTKLRAAVACCPENHCWDGMHCVAPMDEYTETTINVGNDRNYKCIAGDWTYMPLAKDWKNNVGGFCNSESQCFVMSSKDGQGDGEKKNSAEDFYNGKFPTCIENGEFIFDNYCDNGAWVSRTKFLVSQMLDRVGGNQHELYCNDFKEVLTTLSSEQLQLLGGVNEGPVGIDGIPTTVCFSEVQKNKFARNLVEFSENKCINNVCVLNHNGKTAFATTLNHPIVSDDSFANTLDINPASCATQGNFGSCSGGLYYSKILNAAWFTKDGLSPSAGIIERVVDFFRELLTRQTEIIDLSLLDEIDHYNKIYSNVKGNKKVLAVQESYTKDDTVLVAEFEGFNTPVCSYVDVNNIDHSDFQVELLEGASGYKVLSCVDDGNVQRVEVVSDGTKDEGLNFLWPQITSKLRIE